MGPPETLVVDYNETVRDVLAKALEIFRISVSNTNIIITPYVHDVLMFYM